MKPDDILSKIPKDMPALSIKKSNFPFFEVKFEENSFIIPHIGNQNASAIYRNGELTLVSVCRVPKRAKIHNENGVQICRDTYHVKGEKFYQNECIWFVQLTDEYFRTLATIRYIDEQEGCDLPAEIHTFLDEEFDVTLNGNDRAHGMPLLIKENPAKTDENGIHIEPNLRYTLGTYDLTIGNKVFETIKCIILQNDNFKELFIDRNGRLILMRWYQYENSIPISRRAPKEYRESIANNPCITVNGKKYVLMDDRINEYAV